MSVTVNGREYAAESILDDLDAAGHYDIAEWAAPHLEDSDFCTRLSEWAESEFEINGDLDSGYDETSAIVSALRTLHTLWTDPASPPELPVDRNPRGRLSGLAERRQDEQS